jgi:hypothetical protein
MKKPNLVLLVVENNDYQAEQTTSVKEAAHECEADLQVIRIEHVRSTHGKSLNFSIALQELARTRFSSNRWGRHWPNPPESQRHLEWGGLS